MKGEYKLRKFKCKGCGKNFELRRMKDKLSYCSLGCYRNSLRPERKTGKIIDCEYCGKETYKRKCFIEKSKNLFCSQSCANKFQGRNKLRYICKICGKEFKWSKSREVNNNPTYCSMNCRNKDTERLLENSIKGNLVQQNKKGLNKLELKGRAILQDLGLKLDKDFREQVLMFNKFLVDVLIISKKLIIQWDGEYWHNRKKRKSLDISQDSYFKKCGYKVLRVTDKQMREDLENVINNIKRTI